MPLRPAPHRRATLLAAACVALVGPLPAQGAALTAPAQPLAMIGHAERPSCTSELAPFSTSQLFAWPTGGRASVTRSAGPRALRADLEATAQGADLLPSVTICSPTFAGIPGPIEGTTSGSLSRTRVGRGWRELGSTLLSPAPLVPGDTLTMPAVDDAAEARLAVAPRVGAPTTVLRLTDLAPGPSQVSISADPRGLVARIVRADGTTAEAVGQPRVLPALAPKLAGTARRWTITSRHLPGTTVLVSANWDDYFYDEEGRQRIVRTGAAATTRVMLPMRRARTSRIEADLFVLASNREAQSLRMARCRVRLDRSRAPRHLRCREISVASVAADYAEQYLVGGRAGERSAAQAAAILEDIRTAIAGPAAADVRAPAAGAPSRPRLASRSGQPVARDGDLASRAAVAAPLRLAETRRSAEMQALGGTGVRLLQADVNGDGAPDFWTDELSTSDTESGARRSTAGFIYVSGPAGLSPHRVDAPSLPAQAGADDSELSAIDDVTGDGLGELIVDLGDRHAVIPGSTAWTGTTTPINAPDPASLGADQIILAPQLSSPGAAYAALDDVTGDGLRELAVTDDWAAWLSIAGASVRRGAVTPVPSGARAIPVPLAPEQNALMSAAPKGDQALRVIGGRAVGLRWGKRSTPRSPAGSLSVAVHDALGRAVAQPRTIVTPGDASLLDYDRRSGDLLLFSVDASCDSDRYGPGPCRETLLRVRPDGAIRQRLGVKANTGVAVSSARFMTDGADADGDAEVVLTAAPRDVLLLGSTVAGTVKATTLPRATLTNVQRMGRYSEPVRLLPLVAPDGSRRLVSILGGPGPRGRLFSSAPAELVWTP